VLNDFTGDSIRSVPKGQASPACVCDALPARPRQVPLGKKHIPEDPWKITMCRDHSFDEEKRFYVGRDMKIATR